MVDEPKTYPMTTPPTLSIYAESTRPPQRKQRLVLLGILIIFVVTALLAARAYLLPPALNGVVLQSLTPAYNFTLPSSSGKTMSLRDFRGKYVLLNFGYTSCPDVCPMQLADLAKVVTELGDKAEQVQVLFVSIDPERDTPERLGAYLAHFDASFIGMTGAQEEIAAAATAFGIFYEKSQLSQTNENSAADNSYFMDHTSTIMVIDPEGFARLLYPADTPPAEIAADLAALIR